jgi:hypothetical protein
MIARSTGVKLAVHSIVSNDEVVRDCKIVQDCSWMGGLNLAAYCKVDMAVTVTR